MDRSLVLAGDFYFWQFCVIINFMMLLEGKKIAEEMLDEVKNNIMHLKTKLRLGIVMVGKDPVVEKFIRQKKKTAAHAGIEMRIYAFDENITTNELRKRISEIVHEKKNSAVVVQLPLPPHINSQYILNAVTPEKDADMLSAKSIGDFVVGKSEILPPVAGATKIIFDYYQIPFREKRIVVAGTGSLVGRPVALWLLREHSTFTVINKSTQNSEEILKEADIIISGMGAPRFITKEKVKEGVIIIDAGTSESEGKLVGDADPESLKEKASYITPVPGGVGPLTVAVLLKNVLALARAKNK